MKIIELNMNDIDNIKSLFVKIFSSFPWFDDWSDEEQLDKYLIDLCGNKNSLIFGLLKNKKLIGISIGNVVHWWQGTTYYIDEFGIDADFQHKGIGSYFITEIKSLLKKKKIFDIILQTEYNVLAYDFYLKNDFKEQKETVVFYTKVE